MAIRRLAVLIAAGGVSGSAPISVISYRGLAHGSKDAAGAPVQEAHASMSRAWVMECEFCFSHYHRRLRARPQCQITPDYTA